jgi:amino acid transporter
MTTRPAIRSLLLVGITLLLCLVTFILIQAPQATDAGMLIIYSGFGMLVGFAGIATVIWLVFVIIGSIRLRDRPRSRRVLWFIASAVVGASVNVIVISALSAGADGWGGLIVGIAVGAAVVFVACASAATVLVEFLILRDRSTPVPSVAL